MEKLTKEFEIKWADLDPNRHMRHSAYNDYAAHMRLKIMEDTGLSIKFMESLFIGPILFREETKFLREVGMQGNITVTCQLNKAREDGSRWSFYHEVIRHDGIKAAEIVVDGAWIDLKKRKLAVPPSAIKDSFLAMPRTEDFQFI